mgnify:CR=1 FL=1
MGLGLTTIIYFIVDAGLTIRIFSYEDNVYGANYVCSC